MVRSVHPTTHLHLVEKAAALESRLRLWLQNPGRILKNQIHPGMTVLDLGCGTGYFTPEIAKLLENQGKVIATCKKGCRKVICAIWFKSVMKLKKTPGITTDPNINKIQY